MTAKERLYKRFVTEHSTRSIGGTQYIWDCGYDSRDSEAGALRTLLRDAILVLKGNKDINVPMLFEHCEAMLGGAPANPVVHKGDE